MQRYAWQLILVSIRRPQLWELLSFWGDRGCHCSTWPEKCSGMWLREFSFLHWQTKNMTQVVNICWQNQLLSKFLNLWSFCFGSIELIKVQSVSCCITVIQQLPNSYCYAPIDCASIIFAIIWKSGDDFCTFYKSSTTRHIFRNF